MGQEDRDRLGITTVAPVDGAAVRARMAPDPRYARIAELEGALADTDQWILQTVGKLQYLPKDHACAQCVPNSEIIRPGFVCAFHAAQERALSAVRAARGK